MNKLFLITGPAGVGKSTISNKIAESLEKSVLIEGDDIYNFVIAGYVSPWKEGNHLDLFWENCISVIKNSLANGYDVVFNYILDKKQVENIRLIFENFEIKFICLMVDEKTIIKRDRLRPKDCQMGERSLILLKELENENFEKQYILDSSQLTVENTYKEILNNDRFIMASVKNDNGKYLGAMVKVIMDRPLGTKHPKHGFIYSVNYGYIPNTISADGEELDAYVLGIHKPLNEFEGEVIAIIHRTNDNDDKLIVVPKEKEYSDEQIRALTEFQEQWFESIIIRKN